VQPSRSNITAGVLVAASVFLTGPTASASLGEQASAQRASSGAILQLRLVEGTQRLRFTLRRPPGVVLTFRLTLPRGTRAYLTGRIGGVAGVMISTDHQGCRADRGMLVCEQQVEWCPLPRGTWGFRLHKLTGPRGHAKLEFRIGTPPANA
jgi:hypothetical protein